MFAIAYHTGRPPGTGDPLRRPSLLVLAGATSTCSAVIFAVEAGVMRTSQGLLAAVLLLSLSLLSSGWRGDKAMLRTAAGTTVVPPLLIAASGGGVYLVMKASVILLLGWAAALPWLGRDQQTAEDLPKASIPVVIGGLVLLGTAAWSVLGSAHAFVIDHNLYLLQADQLLHPERKLSDPELMPFFQIRQTFVRDGQLHGQYPPGWPGALASARAIGFGAWVGPMIYAATLLAVAGLTKSMGLSRRATVLALALTGGTALSMLVSISLFAHGFVTLLLLLAALALIRAEQTQDLLRAWLNLAISGLLVGLAFTTRPLTGLVGFSAILWWRAFVLEGPVRTKAARLVPFIVGTAIPVVWLLTHNLALTGSPLTFGYDLAHEKARLWRTRLGLVHSRGAADQVRVLVHAP